MKNNKGFVLVETLVVTVFVMTVFTLLFVNYTPALSEFERREYSDDIDSKYDLYWVKKMIQSETFLPESNWRTKVNTLYDSNTTTHTYVQVTKNWFPTTAKQNDFDNLINNIGIARQDGAPLLYFTKYSLSRTAYDKYHGINGHSDIRTGGFFKDYLLEGTPYGHGFDSGLVEYVEHLPDYTQMSMNYAEFRLIAKFERKIDPNLEGENDNIYYTYATIEVIRE